MGINDRGQVVGEYLDATGRYHGYVWERGRFTTIDVPGTAGTSALDINNRGQVTGLTGDLTAPDGFLLDRGRVTTFDAPEPRSPSRSDSTTAARSWASAPTT